MVRGDLTSARLPIHTELLRNAVFFNITEVNRNPQVSRGLRMNLEPIFYRLFLQLFPHNNLCRIFTEHAMEKSKENYKKNCLEIAVP